MTGKRLQTRDRHALAPSNVRPGDTVAMPSAAVVVDTAQSRASIDGITTLSPDPTGDVMTVQVGPARTILVDIGSNTRINGKLPSAGSRLSVPEASPIRVVGILDKTLDEVTETMTIQQFTRSIEPPAISRAAPS
jgi:hypothetical protein